MNASTTTNICIERVMDENKCGENKRTYRCALRIVTSFFQNPTFQSSIFQGFGIYTYAHQFNVNIIIIHT